MESNRILLLFVHPAFQHSRANRQLLEAVRDLEGLTVHDLYEEYPDFAIDVPREQRLLKEHDLIVFQHPFYWYSCPALLKEWLDLVLEYGFAYGPGGAALKGKMLLSAVTTGGGPEAYRQDGHNRFTIRQLLAPFEQTAALCGMRYLPPFVTHGMRQRPGDELIRVRAAAYRQALTCLRDNAFDLEALTGADYLDSVLIHPHAHQKEGDHA